MGATEVWEGWVTGDRVRGEIGREQGSDRTGDWD